MARSAASCSVYNKHMTKTPTTADVIRSLGTILFVAAHPDDETFCSGGLLATAARNGQRVLCVTATRGEAGVQDEERWPAGGLGEIRAHELAQALGVLGVTEHYWLDYQDGECAQAPEREASQAIANLIERCGVETVVTFGPDGLTGHPDHQAVSRWTDAAVHIATRMLRILHIAQPREPYQNQLRAADAELNIFFMTSQPPLVDEGDCAIYFQLDHRSVVQKYRALQAMPSQTTKLLEVFPPEKFAKAFGVEALVEAGAAQMI